MGIYIKEYFFLPKKKNQLVVNKVLVCYRFLVNIDFGGTVSMHSKKKLSKTRNDPLAHDHRL